MLALYEQYHRIAEQHEQAYYQETQGVPDRSVSNEPLYYRVR